MQMTSISLGYSFSSVSPGLCVYIYCVAAEDLTSPLSSPFKRGFTEPYSSLWWYSVRTIKPHYSSECIYMHTLLFKVMFKHPHIAVMHIYIYMNTQKIIISMDSEITVWSTPGYLYIPAIILTVLNTYMSLTSKICTISQCSTYCICV